MILGTHNTMTYRNPKKWYCWPIKWMAQCQSVDYKTQHEKYGVNAFDLRLFWDKNGNIEFRHGGFAYPADDFEDILKYCEDNNILVRVLFEERLFPKSLAKLSKEMNLKQKFIDTCKWIEETYPKLKCWCGRNCGTWELVYKFDYDPKDTGYYSSVTTLFNSDNKILKIIDDWCPRIYALINNKKHFKELTFDNNEDEIISLDFVNIQ